MIRSVTALAASTDAGAPADPGFGVYVHWPFCLSKCPYCDFNSHVRGAAIDEARYLAAFKAEIAHRAALAPRPQGSLGVLWRRHALAHAPRDG